MKLPQEILDRITWRKQKKDVAELPVIESLSYPVAQCEHQGCSRIVEGSQRTVKQFRRTPIPHWSDKCVTCGMFRDHRTGNYDHTWRELEAVLRSESKKRNK